MTFIHVPMPNKIPEISLKYINGARTYETPDGDFDSITSILGKLPRFSFGIQNWIKKVGKDFAKFESKRCLERGTQFHKIVQSYLENNLVLGDFDILPQALFQNAINELNQSISFKALNYHYGLKILVLQELLIVLQIIITHYPLLISKLQLNQRRRNG